MLLELDKIPRVQETDWTNLRCKYPPLSMTLKCFLTNPSTLHLSMTLLHFEWEPHSNPSIIYWDCITSVNCLTWWFRPAGGHSKTSWSLNRHLSLESHLEWSAFFHVFPFLVLDQRWMSFHEREYSRGGLMLIDFFFPFRANKIERFLSFPGLPWRVVESGSRLECWGYQSF